MWKSCKIHKESASSLSSSNTQQKTTKLTKTGTHTSWLAKTTATIIYVIATCTVFVRKWPLLCLARGGLGINAALCIITYGHACTSLQWCTVHIQQTLTYMYTWVAIIRHLSVIWTMYVRLYVTLFQQYTRTEVDRSIHTYIIMHACIDWSMQSCTHHVSFIYDIVIINFVKINTYQLN